MYFVDNLALSDEEAREDSHANTSINCRNDAITIADDSSDKASSSNDGNDQKSNNTLRIVYSSEELE